MFSLMGALSAKYDENFVRLILGDDYVNMTAKILRTAILSAYINKGMVSVCLQ